MNERPRGDARQDRIVDWRSTEDGLELFDAEDPDAWIAMEFRAGIPPEHRLFAVCPECGFAAPQRVPPGTRMVCGACDAELGE